MIVNVIDYSEMIRSNFFRSKKNQKKFYIDLIVSDIKSAENQEALDISGCFYNCKGIKTLFIYFQHNEIIFLAKKDKNSCIIYNLMNSKVTIDITRKLIFFKTKKCIIKSDKTSSEFFYSTNRKDEWMVNTDFLETPDFFEWISHRLEGDRKNGIKLLQSRDLEQ